MQISKEVGSLDVTNITYSILSRYPKLTDYTLVFTYFNVVNILHGLEMPQITPENFRLIALSYLKNVHKKDMVLVKETRLKVFNNSTTTNSMVRAFGTVITTRQIFNREGAVQKLLNLPEVLLRLFTRLYVKFGFSSPDQIKDLFVEINKDIQGMKSELKRLGIKKDDSSAIMEFLASPVVTEGLLATYDGKCERAKKHLDQQEYEAAHTLATGAISVDSAATEAYWIRAIAAAKMNNLKQAIEDIEKAITIDPDDYYLIEIQKLINTIAEGGPKQIISKTTGAKEGVATDDSKKEKLAA